MSARNPSDAIRAYIQPLQQSLGYVCSAILRPSGYASNVTQSLTLPRTIVEVASDTEVFSLSFMHSFLATRATDRRRWDVDTVAYYYALEDENGDEIVAYHWHPQIEDASFPHLHLGSGARVGRAELQHAHMPTGRISFEDFLSCIIREFGVHASPGWKRSTAERQP